MFSADFPIQTNSFGIFPADVIIRSALLEAIKDLRAKPWLLRYCFSYLNLDSITKQYYGMAEVNRAVEWFLTHEIPVFLNLRIDDIKLPAISIRLVNSAEAEDTLGDVHYAPTEDSNIDWPNLVGPFITQSYDPITGIVILPDSAAKIIVLSPGQLLIDADEIIYEILEVLDFTQIKISTNLRPNFTKAYIRGQKPAYQTHLESKLFKETYQIGCYAQAEATHANYLYMIVLYILLMYKQSLFEARNIERTAISATDFIQNPSFGEELVYSRHINFTGFVRQMWPKHIGPKINAITYGIVPANSSHIFPDPIEAANQLWVGSDDFIGNGSLPSDSIKINPVNNTNAASPLVYFGVATQPGSYTEAFVESLTFNIPSLTRQIVINYNAGLNQYCWYAYPASYGGTSDDFFDNQTNFLFGMGPIATVNVTDNFNITRLYNIARSDFPNLGVVTLKVI